MTKNHDKPPKMREPYSSWKLELDLWAEATDYQKHQIGPVIVLSLEGDARDAALTIPKDELKSENGMQLILETLDALYQKDETQLAFLAIDQLVNYRRPQDMDMNDFLRKFELMKSKCSTYDLKLPDGVLGYFMLKCANLPEDKSDVVRATIDKLTVKNVRSKILSIYTNVAKSNASSSSFNTDDHDSSYRLNSTMILKQEPDCSGYTSPVLFGQSPHSFSRGRGRNSKGSSRFNRTNKYNKNINKHSPNDGGNSSYSGTESRLNPIDPSTGQPSLCNGCGSYYHWQNQCPDVPRMNSRKKNTYLSHSNSQQYDEPL